MKEIDGEVYWDGADVAQALDVAPGNLSRWWDGGAPRPALRVRAEGDSCRRLYWRPADVLAWAAERPGWRGSRRPCLDPGFELGPAVRAPTPEELPEALRAAAAEVAAEVRAGGRWCTSADVLAVYAGTTRAGAFEEFERSTLILGLLRKRGLRSQRRRVRERDEARSSFA